MDLADDITRSARAAIALLYRRPNWVRPSQADLDVAIIGGGQSGVGLAFALNRAGIHRTGVFDAAPEGQSGVWATTARMQTLRTDKGISALDQGIPELTFAHWFDAQNGAGAFARLERIPRLAWADYLGWLQRVFGIAVTHDTRLVDIRPHAAGLSLSFDAAAGPQTITARRLVLATGVDGLGAPFVPAHVLQHLPRDRWSHTADAIDFDALRGRRVFVIGAAASAFDAAATALEQGAAAVHLLARNTRLATVPAGSLAQNPGLYRPFRDLPDDVRWRVITEGRARGHAPPASIARAKAQPGFHLHEGIPAERLRFAKGAIRVALAEGTQSGDHLIVATGYRTDLTARPELAALAAHATLWRDIHGPARHSPWGLFPYLDRDLAFRPSRPEGAWINRIHAFNFGAILSHGYHVGDIGSQADCIARLVASLSDRLFAEEAAQHIAAAGYGPAEPHHAAAPVLASAS